MSFVSYVKRTEYRPIDIFFRGVKDIKTNKMAFIDAFQVLNDQEMGRMSVANYFFIAEQSVRINDLNLIALDELKNYHLVMRENFFIPKNLMYCLPITTRFLESDKDFAFFTSYLKEKGYKKGSIILSFNADALMHMDLQGLERYKKLKRLGHKICVSGFGEDFNALDIFNYFKFDYIRCEAKYFDTTDVKKNLLKGLVTFCKANKTGLIMEGVTSPASVKRYKQAGVQFVTGRGVAKITRYVTNEYLGNKELKGKAKEDYLLQLAKDLTAQEQSEIQELDKLRRIAREKNEKLNVTPSAPRPELEKSPYTIRLQQQKNKAKVVYEFNEEDIYKHANVVNKDALENGLDASNFGGIKLSNNFNEAAPIFEEVVKKPKKEKKVEVNEEVSVELNARPKKEIKFAKDATEENVYDELEDITIVDTTESVEVKGHLNDKQQWVDEDGNVYDGYYDENGNWVEYEKFDANSEGHYNEYYQWVDKDGVVYDGYFDEENRWIDYTYTDQNGEVVDNGYFDDKLKKWVPYGYFDDNGEYHKF